jgi:hypothetical protein
MKPPHRSSSVANKTAATRFSTNPAIVRTAGLTRLFTRYCVDGCKNAATSFFTFSITGHFRSSGNDAPTGDSTGVEIQGNSPTPFQYMRIQKAEQGWKFL